MIDVDMRVTFSTAAHQELLDAVDYLNLQSEGLGFEFAAEVRRTLDRIVGFPEAWTKLSARARKCRTDRFPYGVIYQLHSEEIRIVAVMHMHRDPQEWQKRV